jgi:hypothetical protein
MQIALHKGRGAADRGEYRQAAGAASEKCPSFPTSDTPTVSISRQTKTTICLKKTRFRPAHV